MIQGPSAPTKGVATRLMRARSATARMHELIESLLLFAREESDERCITPVSPVVREAIAMQQEMFAGAAQPCPEIVFDARGEAEVSAPASESGSLRTVSFISRVSGSSVYRRPATASTERRGVSLRWMAAAPLK